MCPGGKMRAENSKEEQYRKVFKHLDLNGDGKLTAAELRRCLVAEEVANTDGEEADGMRIEIDEFVRMMMMEEEEEQEDEKDKGLREAFKMYEDDKVRDFITAGSLKRMLSRLGEKKSVGDCEAMISVFDLDGDGLLSFHEFKIMMS